MQKRQKENNRPVKRAAKQRGANKGNAGNKPMWMAKKQASRADSAARQGKTCRRCHVANPDHGQFFCPMHPRMCPDCGYPTDMTDQDEHGCVCDSFSDDAHTDSSEAYAMHPPRDSDIVPPVEQKAPRRNPLDNGLARPPAALQAGLKPTSDDGSSDDGSDASSSTAISDVTPSLPPVVVAAARSKALDEFAELLGVTPVYYGGRNTHAKSAMERRAKEDYMYTSLLRGDFEAEERGENKEAAGEIRIVAAGGSTRDHYRGVNWVCNYSASHADFGRDVAPPCLCNQFRRCKAHRNVCDCKIEDCKHYGKADVFVMTHVYLEPDVIAKLVNIAEMGKVFAIVHNMRGKATYWNGEARSTTLRTGNSVMWFAGQPAYEQGSLTWLSRFGGWGMVWKVIDVGPHTLVLEFRRGIPVPVPPPRPRLPEIFPLIRNKPQFHEVPDMLSSSSQVLLFRYPHLPVDSDYPIIVNAELCRHLSTVALGMIGMGNDVDLLQQRGTDWCNNKLKGEDYADAIDSLPILVPMAIEHASLERKAADRLVDRLLPYPERGSYSRDSTGTLKYKADWAIVRVARHSANLAVDDVKQEFGHGWTGTIQEIAKDAAKAALNMATIVPIFLSLLLPAFLIASVWYAGGIPGLSNGPAGAMAGNVFATFGFIFRNFAKRVDETLTDPTMGTFWQFIGAIFFYAIFTPLWEEAFKRTRCGWLLKLLECNNKAVIVWAVVYTYGGAYMAKENAWQPAMVIWIVNWWMHSMLERLPYYRAVVYHGIWNAICVFIDFSLRASNSTALVVYGTLSLVPPSLVKFLGTVLPLVLTVRANAFVPTYLHPQIIRPHHTWREDHRQGIRPIGPVCLTHVPLTPALSTNNEYAAIFDRMLVTFNATETIDRDWYTGLIDGSKIKPKRHHWIKRFPRSVQDRINRNRTRAKANPSWAKKQYLKRKMHVKYEKLDKWLDAMNGDWRGPRPIEASNDVLNDDLGPSFYATSKLLRKSMGMNVTGSHNPWRSGPGQVTYAPGSCSEDLAYWMSMTEARGLTRYVCRDRKRFDSSINDENLAAMSEFYLAMGWSERKVRRMERFHRQHSFESSSGIRCERKGGVSTGWPGTSVGNSMLTAAFEVTALRRQGYKGLFMLIVAGDDSILALPAGIELDWEYEARFGLSPKTKVFDSPTQVDFLSGRFYDVEPYFYRGRWLTKLHGPKIGKQLLKIGWDTTGERTSKAANAKLKGELISHYYDWAAVPILSSVVSSGLRQLKHLKAGPPPRESIYFPRPIRSHVSAPGALATIATCTGVTESVLAHIDHQIKTTNFPFQMAGAELLLEADQ